MSEQIPDYRQYDQVWQRVAPTLPPYGTIEMTPQMPEQQPAPPQADSLPGAIPNPCCMGTAAQEELSVITGYIQSFHALSRSYAALGRCAPPWARMTLQHLQEEARGQARRLETAYYLITGRCLMSSAPRETLPHLSWCSALRSCYHAAACGGFNLARSADETTDPCLQRLFRQLSQGAYRQSDILSQLLERSLGGGM